MAREISRHHLPFSMPDRPHALSQEWRNLTFMHWEVNPEKIEPYIPEGLELDLFEGKAYVGVIPFQMKTLDLGFFLLFPESRHSLNSISERMSEKMERQEFYF